MISHWRPSLARFSPLVATSDEHLVTAIVSAVVEEMIKLGLNDEELAVYDALAENQSAIELMGNEKLKVIATKLIGAVRKNVTIDWTLRESARAKIRVIVRRILRKHG